MDIKKIDRIAEEIRQLFLNAEERAYLIEKIKQIPDIIPIPFEVIYRDYNTQKITKHPHIDMSKRSCIVGVEVAGLAIACLQAEGRYEGMVEIAKNEKLEICSLDMLRKMYENKAEINAVFATLRKWDVHADDLKGECWSSQMCGKHYIQTFRMYNGTESICAPIYTNIARFTFPD